MKKAGITALPNLITSLRVVLVPLFILMMVGKKHEEAMFVFAAACLTDAFDGLTARAFNMRSTLGIWLDPIADKLLLTSAFVVLAIPSLSYPYRIPVWLAVVCIGRDFLIGAAVLTINLAKGLTTFRPSLIGKTTTVVQVVTLFLVLAANSYGNDFGLLPEMYYLTGLITLASAVFYTAGIKKNIGSGSIRPEA